MFSSPDTGTPLPNLQHIVMATAFLTHRFVPPLRTTQRRKLVACATSPPPPTVKTPVYRPVPIFGWIYDAYFRRDSNIQLARRFGSVYKADLLGNQLVVITDLDAINACYKNPAVFRSAGGYPKTLNDLFGEKAMFTLDGELHMQKRASVLPAFSSRLFPLYFATIREATDRLWSSVSTRVSIDGKVCMKDIIKGHYFRIILNITSGNTFTTSDAIPEEQQYNLLRDKFISLSSSTILVSLAPGFIAKVSPAFKRSLASSKWLCDTLSILIRDRLSERKETINALRAKGPDKLLSEVKTSLSAGDVDFLTVLCASSSLPTGENQNLPAEELKELAEQVLFLWFAGYATQSTLTLNSIMLAKKDESIWTRLRNEQDEIMETDGNRELTFEQVQSRMPLLDSYIMEVLRMYPSAAVLFRKASEDTFVLGHKIDAGTSVCFDLWASQRNAKYYPQPDELVIDRFLKKDGVPLPPAIVAFGSAGGVHYCLGAALAKVTIKATLASLLRGFEIHLEEGQDDRIMASPEMIPRSGVIVDRCERRKVEVEHAVAM